MRGTGATTVPVAAFGDLEAGSWAVAIGGSDPRLVLGSLDGSGQPETAPAAFETSASGAWTLTAAGHTLTVAPAPAASAGEPSGAVELCRVQGTAGADGSEREIDHAGVRCAALDVDKLDSLRLLAAWFPEGVAVGLIAIRPSGARGNDRDAVAAAISGQPEAMHVYDPRLSSTCGRDGSLIRAGIELWLGESEDGDLYPRRFAGESTGAHTVLVGDGFRTSAYPLRCHSRGGDGAGIWIITRPG